MFFKNRVHAGTLLAETIRANGRDFTGWGVIGIARGGVIIGEQIASALALPLQSFVVDDLGIDNGKFVITGTNFGRFFSTLKKEEDWVIPNTNECGSVRIEHFTRRLAAKQQLFNAGQELTIPPRVILCDDGLVSGASARVAIEALRRKGTKEIVLAIPVIPKWFMSEPRDFDILTWRTSTLSQPSTGIFYYEFSDTPDESVVEAIQKNRAA